MERSVATFSDSTSGYTFAVGSCLNVQIELLKYSSFVNSRRLIYAEDCERLSEEFALEHVRLQNKYLEIIRSMDSKQTELTAALNMVPSKLTSEIFCEAFSDRGDESGICKAVCSGGRSGS